MLKYETIVTGPFMENCYLLWDSETMEGIFVDPGDDAEKLLTVAAQKKVKVVGIYNTHAHLDHAGAVAPLVDKLDIPFAVHESELDIVDSLPLQPAFFGLNMAIEVPPVDIKLKEGDVVTVGNQQGSVIHTPGHTPGGICFRFDDLLFVGDTLFAGSVGRSDLPGGDGAQLLASIREKLLGLPDDVKVLTGHGPSTTIGTEKRHNPYVSGGGIL